MSIQRIAADLAKLNDRAETLRAKAAEIASEIVEVERQGKELRIAISILSRYESSEPLATPLQASTQFVAAGTGASESTNVPSDATAAPQPKPYHGKGMAEAAIVALTLRGSPMTYVEITDELLSGGVLLAAKTPASSVQAALRSAENRKLLVRHGAHKWALPSWSRDQIDEAVHTQMVDRVKKSLAISKERGVPLGRPTRMTEELKSFILEQAKKGVTQRKISEQVGFTTSHIGRLLKREGMPIKTRKSKARPTTGGELQLDINDPTKLVLN